MSNAGTTMVLDYEPKSESRHIKRHLPVDELDIALDLLKTIAVVLAIVVYSFLR